MSDNTYGGNPFLDEIQLTIRQEQTMGDHWQDDQEDYYYEDLLGRGKGDGDVYNPPGKPVEHVIEPENGLWLDMTLDLDLPNELEEGDCY